MRELLASMNNPRYVVVRRVLRVPQYSLSMACPSLPGNNKQNAERFQKELARQLGDMLVVYTRNDVGHAVYKKCVKRSSSTLKPTPPDPLSAKRRIRQGQPGFPSWPLMELCFLVCMHGLRKLMRSWPANGGLTTAFPFLFSPRVGFCPKFAVDGLFRGFRLVSPSGCHFATCGSAKS